MDRFLDLFNTEVLGQPAPAGYTSPTVDRLVATFNTAEASLAETADALGDYEVTLTTEASTAAHTQAAESRVLVIVLLLAGVAGAVVVALLVGRSTARRVAQVRDVLEALASTGAPPRCSTGRTRSPAPPRPPPTSPVPSASRRRTSRRTC